MAPRLSLVPPWTTGRRTSACPTGRLETLQRAVDDTELGSHVEPSDPRRLSVLSPAHPVRTSELLADVARSQTGPDRLRRKAERVMEACGKANPSWLHDQLRQAADMAEPVSEQQLAERLRRFVAAKVFALKVGSLYLLAAGGGLVGFVVALVLLQRVSTYRVSARPGPGPRVPRTW
jgi:hypothetical protein